MEICSECSSANRKKDAPDSMQNFTRNPLTIDVYWAHRIKFTTEQKTCFILEQTTLTRSVVLQILS